MWIPRESLLRPTRESYLSRGRTTTLNRTLRYEPLESRTLLSTVPLDINTMIAEGSAVVTHSPHDIGSVSNVFDGNASSLLRSANVNPAWVLIEFDTPQDLVEFQVIGSHTWGDPAYQWMVETADTLTDLNTQSGSYAEVVSWTGTPSDVTSIVTLPSAVNARVARLTFERLTGDDYVHLNEWTLMAERVITSLEIEPADAELEQFDTLQYQAFATDQNGGRFDYTEVVTWSSDDPSIASVDAGGLATGLDVGQTSIVAQWESLEASAGLEVTQYQPGTLDLNATYIARTPRYDYDAEKNNPEPGDAVTFHGHLMNWGAYLPSVDYRWELDGTVVASGTLTDLFPDQEYAVDFPWTWEHATHEISFVVDPDDALAESTEENNVVTDRTDALIVGFWVEQSVYDYFHEYQHELGDGANSWEDWAQRQIDFWNQWNREAVYPTSPSGVLDRVRLDKIVVVDDGELPLAGGSYPTNYPDTSDKTVDYMWGFPATLLGGSMYTNHTSQTNNPFYYEPSLIHELGHARYLIDSYGFDIANNESTTQVDITEGGQPVAGTDYMPFVAWDSVLHYNISGGIMTGPWKGWSPYEAAMLNRIAGNRASQGNYNAPGNIGEFLQDLPDNNHIRFVDTSGTPLSGANVRIYRAEPNSGWYGKYFDDTFDLEYNTGVDGTINVGHNPFTDGAIRHTYGQSNGSVVLRIEHEGDVWFRFLEVTDFNMEYYLGNTTDAYYTVELAEPGSPGEIEVSGWDIPILNGDMEPDAADRTDFGRVIVGESALPSQFVIRNHGGTMLQLTGSRITVTGPNASDFTIRQMPWDRIPVDFLATFQVDFAPSGYGLREAMVTVYSNDADEAAYQFAIQGRGIAALLAGDLNADGMVGSADLDIVRANWGRHVPPGTLGEGDPSGDGLVGSADLDIVRANWGSSVGPAAAIPFTATPPAAAASDAAYASDDPDDSFTGAGRASRLDRNTLRALAEHFASQLTRTGASAGARSTRYDPALAGLLWKYEIGKR